MFGVKRKEKNEDVYFKAVCTTVCETLKSILNTEYKASASDVGQVVGGNNQKVDYETTCRMMKTQARIALDLLENIKKTDKKENRYE